MKAESAFEGQCVKDLRALGYLVYTHADSPRNRKNSRSDSGYPDITFAGRGRVGFIECKVPKKQGVKGSGGLGWELSEGQDLWANAIINSAFSNWQHEYKEDEYGYWYVRSDFSYAIATPGNWDAILEELA